jgi:hypothetical protein
MPALPLVVLRRHVCAFSRDMRASIGVITAMTLVALCGMVGLGLDAAVWYSNSRHLQTMAETTALSVGRLLSDSTQTTASITSVAKNDAMLNGLLGSDTVSVAFGPSGKSPPNASTVTVTVRRNLPMMFSALFFHSAPTVSASATATSSGGSSACIYVLGTGSQTLLVNSSFNLNAPNCEIDVASTNGTAAMFNSGSVLTVKKTCIAGNDTNNGATVGGLTTGCATQANPYKNKLPAQTVGSCTYSNVNYSGTNNLSPGTYCGNFNFNGTGAINLASGLYIFKGAHWNINSGWTITSAAGGVTFYFADNSSYVQFNSGVSVSLTAPTSGTYANILMYEPDGLSTSSFAIDGTSSSGHALQGLVYLPSRNITFNSTYSGTADAFTLVVNQLIFDSNSPQSWSITPASGGGGAGGTVVLTN